jgi:hypothetical protein
MPTTVAGDEPLKRLGGGRWQTRDERFTIEPQSGTWVVVDAEQTDDLGLPLVRGPFRSLTDAKTAIAEARAAPAAASPLADRIGRVRAPGDAPEKTRGRTRDAAAATRGTNAAERTPAPRTKAAATSSTSRKRPAAEPDESEAPAEPRWFAALDPEARRRARRLIARLEEAGAPDPEGMARRDIVGDVPAVTAFAIGGRLDALGADAAPADVAALLAEGRDDDLGVRWRLVDEDDRAVTLDIPKRRVGRKA